MNQQREQSDKLKNWGMPMQIWMRNAEQWIEDFLFGYKVQHRRIKATLKSKCDLTSQQTAG